MKKKGISPLIATVLILGFTVALAAVIMTWGTGFTKRMQETTEETSDIQMMCATDVLFDIKSVCEASTTGGTTDYRVTIANNGNIAIKEFQIRFYASNDNVTTNTFDYGGDGIAAFGLESEIKKSSTTDPYTSGSVYQVEAIPVIEPAGKEITCIQTIDTFGSLTGASPISACT